MINSDENNESALTIDIKDLKSLTSEGADISQMLKKLNLSDSDSVTHLKITNFKEGKLDLREYIGQDKYFKNIKEVTVHDSFEISDVHTHDGVKVYAPRSKDSLNNQVTQKVSVHSYDKDGQEKFYTAPGRLYYSIFNDIDVVDYQNLNGKAPFNEASVKDDPSLGRTNIFCRHLSVAILKAYQEYINDKNAEDKIAQKLTTTYQELFGDVGKITNNVGSEHDRAYYNLLFKAQENHIVGHSQLGKFSKDIFSKMEMGDRQHVLFTTGNHAMAIEYSAKKNDIGEKEYAMKLYDPNNTLTHRRIVSDNLDKASNLEIIVSGNLDKVSSWEMSDFFLSETFSHILEKSLSKSRFRTLLSCLTIFSKFTLSRFKHHQKENFLSIIYHLQKEKILHYSFIY